MSHLTQGGLPRRNCKVTLNLLRQHDIRHDYLLRLSIDIIFNYYLKFQFFLNNSLLTERLDLSLI